MLKIAIGIASYKRPDGLRELLDSLRAQELGEMKVSARVIVVDNNTDATLLKETRAVVDSLKNTFPFTLEYHTEPQRGIVHARNAVVAALKDEEALFFLDDDETADPTWLKTMLSYWQAHPEADILGGPCKRVFRDRPDLAWTADCGLFYSPKYLTGTPVTFVATNNIMLTRKVWQKISPLFDAEFNLCGGSDTYLCFVARKHGFRTFWVEEAMVTEYPSANRATLKWLILRALRTGSVYGYMCRDEKWCRPLFLGTPLKGARGLLRIGKGLLTARKGVIIDGVSMVTWCFACIMGILFKYRYDEYRNV